MKIVMIKEIITIVVIILTEILLSVHRLNLNYRNESDVMEIVIFRNSKNK